MCISVKQFLLSFLFIIFYLSSDAQDSSVVSKPAFVHFSFLYDFPNSFGFTASADKSLNSFIKTKHRGSIIKYRQKDLFISAEVGMYRYPFNYTGLFFMPGIGYRYYKSRYYFTELSVNIGLLRSFYDGTVYKISGNGSISTVPLFGRYYATTGLFYSLNRHVNLKKTDKLFIQVKPALWIQYPFNSFIKMHAGIEAGVSYLLPTESIGSLKK